MRKILFIVWCLGWCLVTPQTPVCAQPPVVAREYTADHPLVYEDAWDLYPYSFLNDKGEPEGFNIDVIRMLMRELGIPYTIKLKHGSEAFADLRDGKSDLMMGLAAGFHDEYGRYGKNAITLFTQSVATPRNKPVAIRNFHDLETNHVIVNAGSLCYHLMKDYGWETNAEPTKDIHDALMRVSQSGEGQVVWNDLSLKWVIRRYGIENLRVTPVNMPHGEYRFMSNDTVLLNRLDDAYSRINATERITSIQNRWFYPDRERRPLAEWVWWAVAGLSVVMVVLIFYIISYRRLATILRNENIRRHKRLALIMETGHVRFWTYDNATRQFTWRNDNGQATHTFDEKDFAARYAPGDFEQVMTAIGVLISLKPKPDEHDQHEITLNVRAHDEEDDEMRHYMLRLAVFKRDREHKATVIICTKKDITTQLEQKRQARDMALRYDTVFNTPVIGIMLFDSDGILLDMNERACEIFEADRDAVLAVRPTLTKVLGIGDNDLDPSHADGFSATQLINLDAIAPADRRMPQVRHRGWLCNEFSLLTVKDDDGRITGIIGFCKDTSDLRHVAHQEKALAASLAKQREEERSCQTDMEHLLRERDIRMVTYSLSEHTLNIYKDAHSVLHSLTQTRCMTLVDERSKRVALHTLTNMDAGADADININISTTLRVGRLPLNLSFTLTPVRDGTGNVTEYYGIVRDVSQLREVERLTAIQQAKIQDLEDTKTSFAKNMVQEICHPMETIASCVEQLDPEQAGPDEATTLTTMLENCNSLLQLISDILRLSRLQTHIAGITRREVNFPKLFESMCSQAWQKHQNPNTEYIIESPYETLVVDIDPTNLGHVIVQLVGHAAAHTHSGSVRVRYDYIGRRLLIAIEDTSEGMPQDMIRMANSEDDGTQPSAQHLGLAICKEIVKQMDGAFEVSSEPGLGTTSYISIPCHATTIRRNKGNLIIQKARAATKALSIIAAIMLLLPASAMAQALSQRYTRERPVTVVCDWEKPPYEYLDDDGAPAGSNIEVMRAVMKALDLPVKFVMKEWRTALMAFERGDADLILANGSRYKGGRWVVSHNIVNYNRIRAATASDSVRQTTLAKLPAKTTVFKPGDYSAHYLQPYGTKADTVEYQQPKVALMGLLSGDYEYFIWGEEPIRWKLKELNLTGIKLIDIDIPVSEIHIIGHDHDLIEAIDNQYSMLKQGGEVAAIQDKWLHPASFRNNTSPLVLFIGLGFLVLVLLCYMMTRLAKTRVRIASTASTQLSDMMQRALHMDALDVIEYDIRHDRYTNIYGRILPPEGMTLEAFILRLAPSAREEFRQLMQRLTDGRCRRLNIDLQWNAATDAQPRWLNFQASLIVETDSKGLPQHIVSALHDVTADMEQEQATLDMRRKYRRMTNHALMAISFYGADGHFVEANDMMRSLCHFEDPDTKRFWQTVSFFDMPSMRGVYDRNTTGELLTCSHLHFPEMGIDSFIEMNIRPINDDDGNISFFFFTATDITDDRNQQWQLRELQREIYATDERIRSLRQRLAFLLAASHRTLVGKGADKRVVTDLKPLEEARQRLARLTEAAKDSESMKNAFMASMTHELRTPLNALVGFGGMLGALGMGEERAEAVRIIRDNSDMLQRLFNDIIASSSIATDAPITIHPRKVDFATAFDDLFLTLQTRIDTSAIDFIKDNPLSTHTAFLDMERLQQVLTNFVINATKFTQRGFIRLGYRLQDAGIYCYCQDTGCGIPLDKQDKVFERFVKLDEFVQGTGLGLAVSKAIALQMGGRIGVESAGPGQGSTFWIWVPDKA